MSENNNERSPEKQYRQANHELEMGESVVERAIEFNRNLFENQDRIETHQRDTITAGCYYAAMLYEYDGPDGLHPTQKEVAAQFGCSVASIRKWYMEVIEANRVGMTD